MVNTIGMSIKGGISNSFTPLQLNKLKFWFNNDNASNITLSTDSVTSQTDETGNYTRVKPTSVTAPVYIPTSLIDNRGRISYQGSNGLNLSTLINDTQGEVFLVIRRRNDDTLGLTNNQFLMAGQDKDVSNRFLFLSDFGNTNAQNNSIGINANFNGTSQVGYASTDKFLSDKKTILNFRSNGTSYSWGWDRDLNRTITVGGPGNNGDWFGDLSGLDLITFGYRNIAGLGYSVHDEYDLLYFNEPLTTDERTNVQNFLNQKHDCYKNINYDLGVVIFGTSNAVGFSTILPNRLKVALPKGYIRTGTNTFANLLFGTNNEGTQYGSEISLISTLSEYLGRDIYLEKLGSGGSRFCTITGANPVTGGTTTWKVSSANLLPGLKTGYTELKTKLNTLGTNKTLCLLIGGENDTFYDADGTSFQTNLTEVFSDLEAVAPFEYSIINKIRTDLAGTGAAPTRQATAVSSVQTGLVNIQSGRQNSVLLDMVNYSSAGDGVHFVGFQQQLIGRDSFEYIKSLL